MYKKGVKSIPRCIKKEIVRCLSENFNSVDDIIPFIHPLTSFTLKDENKIVKHHSNIIGLPSYWIISSKKRKNYYVIVFESKLKLGTEAELFFEDIDFDMIHKSFSDNYGVYVCRGNL